MKTPTPTINIETTFGDMPYLSGWVGEVLADGTRVPEVGAYVYIYINGFLVNPPSFNEDGIYNSDKVFTDSEGNWKTLATKVNENSKLKIMSAPEFVTSSIYLSKGSVVTAKAKSYGKDLSDLSVPYTIKGMVTPTNLGVTGDFGEFRPPKDGEFILMGGLSYWTRDTILQGINRILIYKDGYLIGEVLTNKIVGTDALYPITTETTNLRFSLLVNGEIITLSLADLNYGSKSVLTPAVGDGVNTVFTFPVNNAYAFFRVYKNIRLNNFNTNSPLNDYFMSVDPVLKIATITFTVAPEPSDYIVIYECPPIDTAYNQTLSGVQDGINDTFAFGWNIQETLTTIQLFQNGLHLKRGTDFNAEPDIDYKIVLNTNDYRFYAVFRTPPEAYDVILVDYQLSGITPILITPEITPVSNLIFSLPILAGPGRIDVYKNGLLQIETTATTQGSYTITNNVNNLILQFNAGEFDESAGDVLTVSYEYTPTYLDLFVNVLNNTDLFKTYNIKASVYSKTASFISLTNNYVLGNGTNQTYTIPEYDVSTTVRLFKNGIRQKNGVDYTIDGNTITFTHINNSSDVITSVIQYNTSAIVVDGPYSIINNVIPTQILLPLNPALDGLQVYKNGLRLTQYNLYNQTDADFSIQGNVLTLAVPAIPSDNFIIDYQPEGAQKYIYSYNFTQEPNGIYTGLDFNIPPITSSWNPEVFQDGIKLSAGIDYYISGQTVNFRIAPPTGAKLLIDFYTTEFSVVGDNPQLQLECNATLELVLPPLSQEELNTYRLLFGSKYFLDPGKDTDGEFLYYIRPDTGDWKYSNLNLTTRKAIPFNKGEHLKARALNTSALNASPSTLSEQVTVKDDFHQKYLYDYVPTCIKDIKDA